MLAGETVLDVFAIVLAGAVWAKVATEVVAEVVEAEATVVAVAEVDTTGLDTADDVATMVEVTEDEVAAVLAGLIDAALVVEVVESKALLVVAEVVVKLVVDDDLIDVIIELSVETDPDALVLDVTIKIEEIEKSVNQFSQEWKRKIDQRKTYQLR